MNIGTVWDEKFLREGYLYGQNPNAFLVSQSKVLKPNCTILFLGEGEGRNACYFASRGFAATAIDASPIGLQKTNDLASQLNVTVETILQDLAHFETDQQYDVLMASFLHLSEPWRTRIFREVMNALKPGGFFIAEFFSQNQLRYSSGGPKNSDLLYTIDSLEDIFYISTVKIQILEEVVDFLDEGRGHQGNAALIRMIIEKY